MSADAQGRLHTVANARERLIGMSWAIRPASAHGGRRPGRCHPEAPVGLGHAERGGDVAEVLAGGLLSQKPGLLAEERARSGHLVSGRRVVVGERETVDPARRRCSALRPAVPPTPRRTSKPNRLRRSLTQAAVRWS
jgi:hypothetical protein